MALMTGQPTSFSASEMMIVAAARELAGQRVCFVGVGLPNICVNLAKRTVSAGMELVYEAGVFGAQPARLPVRRRAAITQRRPPALPVAAPEPVAGRPARPAAGRGQRRTHPLLNPPDDLAPRLPREPLPSRPLTSLRHSGPPR